MEWCDVCGVKIEDFMDKECDLKKVEVFMQPCDRCGLESEELIVQPNGEILCPNCHRGLGPEITDLEYNRLRMEYDKDVDFKRLRHRFWALGIQRRYNVLRAIGYAKEGETVFEKIERFRLYKIKEVGLEGTLVGLIEDQEAEILAENEKSDYLDGSVRTPAAPSGRVRSGKVDLAPGPTNPNPWEDSQE